MLQSPPRQDRRYLFERIIRQFRGWPVIGKRHWYRGLVAVYSRFDSRISRGNPIFLYTGRCHVDTRASGIFDFAPKAPLLLAAVGIFTVFDAATLSLFPAYGMQNGLDIATSANILTALILGNALLQ